MMTSQARGKNEPVEASTSTSNSNSTIDPLSESSRHQNEDDTESTIDNDRERNGSLRRTHQFSSDNIDKLLDSGRNGQDCRVMGSSSEEPLRRGGNQQQRDRDTESSADEETNIMRRSSKNNLNYHGTATSSLKKGNTKRQNSRPSTSVEGNEEDEAAEHQGWWEAVFSKYGSIELENKGSVARDHLALERTFLAWLRTSLAFASIGIAITQLFRLNVSSSSSSSDSDRYAQLRSMGKPLGATFLGISIVMLFIGFHRYFESQHWIIRGKFPASRGSIIIVALVTFALMVTSLVVVVVVEPGAREKR